MTPTEEQQAIIDAYRTGRNLVIEAGAGTGKTTTLKMLGAERAGPQGHLYRLQQGDRHRRKTQLPRRRPVRHRALLRLRGGRAHVPAPPQRAAHPRRADREDPRHHQAADRPRRDPRTAADRAPGDGDRPAVLPLRRPGTVRIPRAAQAGSRHPGMPGRAARGAAAARGDGMG